MKKIKNILFAILAVIVISIVSYLAYTYLGCENWPVRFSSELDRYFGKGNWECISTENKRSSTYSVYNSSYDALYDEWVPLRYKDWYISVKNEENEEKVVRISNSGYKISNDKYGVFSGKRESNKQAFVCELLDIAREEIGDRLKEDLLSRVLTEDELECFSVEIVRKGYAPKPGVYSKLWKEDWFTYQKISAENFLACELHEFYIDVFLFDYKYEKLSKEQQEHLMESYDLIREMLLEEFGENASFELRFDTEHRCEYKDGVLQ